MEWHLCAPGPSMSQGLVDSLRGQKVGVVGLVFELAPWADFLAANDIDWWQKYPHAHDFQGGKFTGNSISGVARCYPSLTNWSSGVLALQVAANVGAKKIHLHGFDHKGSHYFGPYTNGLSNTPDYVRKIHFGQFVMWKDANPQIEVVNCTPGSELDCFPMADK